MSKYTPEQVRANAVADQQALVGTLAELPPHVQHVVKAYGAACARTAVADAATLRQQAERGDGAVSDEVVEIACKAASEVSADGIESLAWPDEYDADELAAGRLFMRAALEAVAPLLRAPAEQGGRVDDDVMRSLREVAGKPDDAGWVSSIRPSDARAILAALAQNAQGEAVALLTVNGDDIDATPLLASGRLPDGDYRTYLHAERARVPELMMEQLADAAAALDKLGRRDQCRHLMALHEMLSAPSQPEDAGEVGSSPFCKTCGEVVAYDSLGKKHCACTRLATPQPEDASHE